MSTAPVYPIETDADRIEALRLSVLTRPFDAEFFFLPESIPFRLMGVALERATKALDHLRKDRGEALSQASQHEQTAERLRQLLWTEREGSRAVIRSLEDQLAEAKRAWSPERAEIEKVRASLARVSGESADYRNEIEELVKSDAVGEPCEHCHGTRRCIEEFDRWEPGYGHFTGEREVDCEAETCFGGRQVKVSR